MTLGQHLEEALRCWQGYSCHVCCWCDLQGVCGTFCGGGDGGGVHVWSVLKAVVLVVLVSWHVMTVCAAATGCVQQACVVCRRYAGVGV